MQCPNCRKTEGQDWKFATRDGDNYDGSQDDDFDENNVYRLNYLLDLNENPNDSGYPQNVHEAQDHLNYGPPPNVSVDIYQYPDGFRASYFIQSQFSGLPFPAMDVQVSFGSTSVGQAYHNPSATQGTDVNDNNDDVNISDSATTSSHLPQPVPGYSANRTREHSGDAMLVRNSENDGNVPAVFHHFL